MSITCKSAGWCAATVLLWIGGAPAGWAAPAVPETYQILEQRSIFSREHARAPRTWTPPAARPTPAGAAAPIFTGAVYDETECVALLEDPESRTVSSVHVGQILAQGRIEAITLDYLMVRPTPDAQPRRIDIGHTLTGELPQASAPVAAAAATAPAEAGVGAGASTPGAGPAAKPAGGGNPNDVLERMRQRRMQELQGR